MQSVEGQDGRHLRCRHANLAGEDHHCVSVVPERVAQVHAQGTALVWVLESSPVRRLRRLSPGRPSRRPARSRVDAVEEQCQR